MVSAAEGATALRLAGIQLAAHYVDEPQSAGCRKCPMQLSAGREGLA